MVVDSASVVCRHFATAQRHPRGAPIVNGSTEIGIVAGDADTTKRQRAPIAIARTVSRPPAPVIVSPRSSTEIRALTEKTLCAPLPFTVGRLPRSSSAVVDDDFRFGRHSRRTWASKRMRSTARCDGRTNALLAAGELGDAKARLTRPKPFAAGRAVAYGCMLTQAASGITGIVGAGVSVIAVDPVAERTRHDLRRANVTSRPLRPRDAALVDVQVAHRCADRVDGNARGSGACVSVGPPLSRSGLSLTASYGTSHWSVM